MQSKRQRSRFLVLALGGVVLGGWLHQSGFSTFFQLRDAWRTEAALRKEVADLEARNEQLRDEIEALGDNGDAVEKIAREKLRLAREGEIIILLPDKQ